MRTKTLAAASLTALIALTGCSPASNSGERVSGGTEMHGEYVQPSWKSADGPVKVSCPDVGAGVAYEFTLPQNMDDPRIKALEEFRAKADAPPVNYLLVEVDATKAFGPASPNSSGYVPWGVNYATAEQTSGSANRLYNSSNSPDAWSGWNNGPNGDGDLVEQDAHPGAKGWGILHAEQPISSMVAPAMSPGFHGPVNAPCEIVKD